MSLGWSTVYGLRPDVESTHMTVLSPEDIRAMSVGEVMSATTNERTGQVVVTGFQGFPRAGARPRPKISLNDAAMGTVDNGVPCTTCGKKAQACPGHMGHIELPTAVYNPTKMWQTLSCLKLVCPFCSCVHASPNDAAVKNFSTPEQRLPELLTSPHQNRLRKSGCAMCGMPQPEYSINPENAVEILTSYAHASPDLFESEEERKFLSGRAFSAAEARAILKAVKPKDWALLGFTDMVHNHPANAIQENLFVCPPCTRPAVLASLGSRKKGVDDLTARYQDVLKARDRVYKILGEWLEAGVPLPENFGTASDHAAWIAHIAQNSPEAHALIIEHGKKLAELVLDGASPARIAAALDARDQAIYDLQRSAHEQRTRVMQLSNEIGRTRSGNLPVQRRRFRGNQLTLKEACTRQLNEAVMKLQCQVAGLIAGNIHCPYPAQRELNCIRQRLTGKEGRFRDNHMGKRCTGNARTVITPSPFIGMHELGVPRLIATRLTTAEVVNQYNLKKLNETVRTGPKKIGGAESIYRRDGTLIHLSAFGLDRTLIKLGMGDTVNRHLMTGDPVLFNRQPSLHRYSMMCHIAVVIDSDARTFQFPTNAMTPYNADADGDEMNMHVPQNDISRAEAIELMSVMNNMVNNAKNAPVVGAVQNSSLAASMITDRNRFFDRAQVMQIITALETFYEVRPSARIGPVDRDKPSWELPVPAILHPKPMWTGKQIFSLLLPRGLYYHLEQKAPQGSPDAPPLPKDPDPDTVTEETPEGRFLDKTFSPDELDVLVVDGELLAGCLSKPSIGVGGQLTHAIIGSYGGLRAGSQRACRFLTDLTLLAQHFLPLTGFTVSLRDCIPPPSLVEKQKILHDTVMEFLETVNVREQAGEIEWSPAQRETFMTQLGQTLLNFATAISQNEMDIDNGLVYIQRRAQSKGNAVNITQIASLIGPMTVQGKRQRPDTWLRTNPTDDPRGDMPLTEDLEARGFVFDSYISGLSARAHPLAGAGAREALVGLSVLTAPVGYMTRRMVLHMQGHRVDTDQTVRTTTGHIIQFKYGQDGWDPAAMELVPLPALLASDAAIAKDFSAARTPEELEPCNRMLAKTLEARNAVRDARMTVLQWPIEAQAALPSGFKSLVEAATVQAETHGPIKFAEDHPDALDSLVTPESLEAMLDDLMDTCKRECGGVLDRTLELAIRSRLAPSVVIHKAYMTLQAAGELCERIRHCVSRAKVAPGEMVGVMAAQSIGEPSLQLTMNQFHMAGLAKFNVALGFPRLQELVDASKSISTPICTVYLRAPYCESEANAALAQRELDELLLENLVCTPARCLMWAPPVGPDQPFFDAANVGALTGPRTAFHDEAVICSIKTGPLGQRGRCILDVVSALRRRAPPGIHIFWDDRGTGEAQVAFRFSQTVRFKKPKVAQKSAVGATAAAAAATATALGSFADRETVDYKRGQMLRTANDLITSVVICGVRGVRSSSIIAVDVPAVKEDGALGTRKEWTICTQGAPLAGILARQDLVDAKRTHTHDVHQAALTLGVSAATCVMYHELRNVLRYNGTYVNPHCLLLPVDTAFHSGQGQPFNRFGMNREHNGALARAAFERPVDVLSMAACNGEKNSAAGVTESIFLGQLAPVGTGATFAITNDPMRPVRPMPPQRADLMAADAQAQDGRLAKPMAVLDSGPWEAAVPVFRTSAAQAETITADKSEFIRRVNAAYKRLRDAEERAQDREEPPPAKRQATEAAREEAQLSAPSATFVHTSAPTLAQILAQVRAQQKS